MTPEDARADPRLEEAADLLVDYVREETGIQLDAYDLELRIVPMLKVELEGAELATLEADADADASDLANSALEAAGDVRDRIVEIRLDRIRERLPALRNAVAEELGWDEAEMESLSFELDLALGADVVEGGWPEDGAEGMGWPAVELVVGNGEGEGIDVRVSVNVYAPDDPVDVDGLVDEVRAAAGLPKAAEGEWPEPPEGFTVNEDGQVVDEGGEVWTWTEDGRWMNSEGWVLEDDDWLEKSIAEDNRRQEEQIARAKEELHPKGKEPFDLGAFRHLYDVTGFMGGEPDPEETRRKYEHLYYVTFADKMTMAEFARYLRELDSYGE